MPSDDYDGYSCDAEVFRTGNAAVLICTEDGKEIWVPYSQIMFGSEITEDSEPGDRGVIIFPLWLARKEELAK